MEDFLDLELYSNTSPWNLESNTQTKDGSEHSDTETVKSNKPDTPTLLKISPVISVHTKVEDGLIAEKDKVLMQENIFLDETLELKDKGMASSKLNSLASGNVSVLSNQNDIEPSHFLDAISCSDIAVNIRDYPTKIAIEIHNMCDAQENLCQPVKKTLASPYSVFKLPEEKNPDVIAAKDFCTQPPTSTDKFCQKTKAASSKLLVQPLSPAESVYIANSDAGTASSTKGVISISGETPSIKPLSCPNKFFQKPKTALVKKSIFSESTSNDVTFEYSKDNNASEIGSTDVENLSTKLISSDQRKTTALTKLLVQPSRFPASVKTKTILTSLSTIEVTNSGLAIDAGKGTHDNHPLPVNRTETSGAVNITETSGIAINDQTTFSGANSDIGSSLPSNCADSIGVLAIQKCDKRLNLPADIFNEHSVTPTMSKLSLGDCSKALNHDSRQLYHSATQPDQQDSCYISLSSDNLLTDADNMASHVEDGHCFKKSQVNQNVIMKEKSNHQESVVDIESSTADYKTPEQIQLSKHKMLFSNTLHMILKKKPPVSKPLAVREIKCKNKDKTNQFMSELQKSLEKRLTKPREDSKMIFKCDETVLSKEEEKRANNMKSPDRTNNLSPRPEHLTSTLQEGSSSFKEAQLRLKKHFERKSPNHSNTVVPKNLMALRSNVKELVKQELVYLASMSQPDKKKSEIPSTQQSFCQTQIETPQQDDSSLTPEVSSLINILQKISDSDEALEQTAELIVQKALSDNGLSEAASSTSTSSSWDSILSTFLPVFKIFEKTINIVVEDLGKALADELYGIQKSAPSISNIASNHHFMQMLLESAAKSRQADVTSLPNLHLPEAPRRLPKDISDIWKRSLYKYIQLSEKCTAQLHVKDTEIQTTETCIVQENDTATGNAWKQKCLQQGSASDQQEPSSYYRTISEELTNKGRLPYREVKNSHVSRMVVDEKRLQCKDIDEREINTLHTSNKLMKQGIETSPFCAKDSSESLTEFNSAFSCTVKSDTVYVSLNKSLQPEENQNHEKVKKCQKESRVLAKIKFKRKLSKILHKKRPRSIQEDTSPRMTRHKVLLTPTANMSSAHLHKSTAKVNLFVDSAMCPNPWDEHGDKGMHDIVRPSLETLSLIPLTFGLKDETESIFDNTLSGESSSCFEEDVKVSWSDCLATEQQHPRHDKSGLSLNNTSWSPAVKKVSESIKSCISDICLKHQKCHFHGVEPSGSQSQLLVPSNVRIQPNDFQKDPNTKDNNSSQPNLEPLAPAPNTKVCSSLSFPSIALSHSQGNAVPKETVATAPIVSTGSEEVNCKEEREQSNEVSCSSENLITQINKGANKTSDASVVQNLPTKEPNAALSSVAGISSKADSENNHFPNISSVLISSKKPPLSPRRLQAKPQTDSTNGKTTDVDCKLTTLPNMPKEDSVSPTSVVEVPSASSDVSSTHNELFSATSNVSAPRKEILNIDTHKETSNSYRDGNVPKDLMSVPIPKDLISVSLSKDLISEPLIKDLISVPQPKDLISVPTDKTSKCMDMPIASTEAFKVPIDLPSQCTARSQTCMDGFSVPNEYGSNRTHLEIPNTSREVLNAPKDVFVASRELFNAPWEIAKPPIEVPAAWREGLSAHNEMPNPNIEVNSAPGEMHSVHQKMYNAPQEIFSLPENVLSADKDINSAPREGLSAPKDMSVKATEVPSAPKETFIAPKEAFRTPEVSSTPRVKPPKLLHLEQVKKLFKNIPSTNPDLRSQDVQKPDVLSRPLKESHTTTSPETSDVSEFFIPKKSSNPLGFQLPTGAHLLSPLHSTTSSKACTTSMLSSDANTAVNDSVSQQGSSHLADASNSYGFSNQLSSVTASAQSSSFSKPLPYSKAHINSKLKRAKSFKSKNIPSSSDKTLADELSRPQNTDLLESFPPVMPVTIQNLKEQHNSKLFSAKEPHDSSPSSAESQSVISDIDKHSSLSYELKDKKLKLPGRAFEMRPIKKVNQNQLQHTNPENLNGCLHQNRTDEIIDTNNFNSRPQQASQDLKDNVKYNLNSISNSCIKQPTKAKGLTMSQIKSLYTKNVPSSHLLDKTKLLNSPDENKKNALVQKFNNNLPQPIHTNISVFSPLPQQNLTQDSSKLFSQSNISIQDSLVNSMTMREMNSESTSDKESSSPLASDTDLSPAESSIANPGTTDTDLTSTYSMVNFVSIHSDQKKAFENSPSPASAFPAPKTKHEFLIPNKGHAPNQQQHSNVKHPSHLFKTLSSEFDEKGHNVSSHTFVNLYAPLTKQITSETHQAGERRSLNENQYFLRNHSVYPLSPQYFRDHAKEARPIRQGRTSVLAVKNYEISGQSSFNQQHPIPSNQFLSSHNQQSQLYTASSLRLQQDELLYDHIYQQQQDYRHLQADFNHYQQQEYNHARDQQEYNHAQGPQECKHAHKQDEYDNYCNHQHNYNQSWQSCSYCTHSFNGKPSWQLSERNGHQCQYNYQFRKN
ncbi:hypothetical protein Bpfe_006053 [Biomphalaria pfeifferi]|uniref:Uncharacterized protein n=1 Tax=Biomphalaria pfeifferi TaxID=112525 RepID=A0AAD8C0R8_BIOPF|nr:hypothetical protein Bpfe_006053 [Biomphalaria pfeifferi]